MLVWQLLQGQQQQLQGEANAKATRQENLPRSPRKAKGFIFHPPPQPMGSLPNEALDLFIFSPHCTEASFNSFGHWGIAKTAAKLSSQHRSICGKNAVPSTRFVSAALGRGWRGRCHPGGGNDGLHPARGAPRGWTSLTALQDLYPSLSHLFRHPKIFPDFAT